MPSGAFGVAVRKQVERAASNAPGCTRRTEGPAAKWRVDFGERQKIITFASSNNNRN